MPQSKSAKKRVKQNEKSRMENKAVKSSMRSRVKEVKEAIATGDKAAAEKAMAGATKKLDKAAKSNIIHKNQAARRKSRLQKEINNLD